MINLCDYCDNKHLCRICVNHTMFAYKPGVDDGIYRIYSEGFSDGHECAEKKQYDFSHKFKCPICGNPFSREIGVKMHLKDKHGIIV